MDPNRLEHILEGISGGFFALDKSYHFTYWNRAAEEGTGIFRGDVLGKNVFDVFPKARGAELGERYRKAMEEGSLQLFETSYRDERFEAWYDVRIYPTESGISVFFQDISDRKRQQRQKEMLLEISQIVNVTPQLDDLCLAGATRLAQFLEIPTPFVCIYLFDSRTSLLSLIAPSLPEHAVPTELEHQILHPQSESVTVQAALSGEVTVTDELTRHVMAEHYIGEMESLRLRTLVSLPLKVQNELQGVLEVFLRKDDRYIEDDLKTLTLVANELAIGMSRKRLMYEITVKNIELENEKKKTEDANEALRRFLATFSHELRAPLNSIVGFSEILTNDVATLPPDKTQDFMKNINESGKHLQCLINDILDLSKIEAGKMELHVEAYPVLYFVESLRRVLQGALEARDITLACTVASDVEQLVVDQTRFKQILVNLVSNAIKYGRQSSTITLDVRRVENEIEVRVIDEGPGIKPEDASKLFNAYQQLGNGPVAKEGTGLGLVITKKLVELHGGHIWVESEWEKGTTFSFRIPMVLPGEIVESAEQLTRVISTTRTPKPGAPPLALIIEDNDQASQLLRAYLEEAGYRTEVATNGMDGVEKAKELQPNVITLDIFMPMKNGWQVLRELKNHPVCRSIPIIIISISDEKKLGFSMGALDYFVKPVSRAELHEALERVHLQRPSRKNPRVLVIDDDKTALDLMQVMLESEGYRVTKSLNGKEGVRLATEEQPDLIILDLIMPDVSGFNVAYQLKQQSETCGIPIIILTSMDIDDDTRDQMQGFISGIVSKARFTKKDLLREIDILQKLR